MQRHLGASTVEGVNDAKFDFKRVIEETFEVFKNLGLEGEKIPLILAGGMANFEKVKTALKNWKPPPFKSVRLLPLPKKEMHTSTLKKRSPVRKLKK